VTVANSSEKRVTLRPPSTTFAPLRVKSIAYGPIKDKYTEQRS
jgi:hypothetical protein